MALKMPKLFGEKAASAIDTDLDMPTTQAKMGAAAQGMPGAVAAVKESRERFRAALDAFLAGGTARGVSLDVTQDPAVVDLLAAVKARWEKVNAAVDRLLGNEATLTALANSQETIGKNGAGLPELAQQAGQQMLQAGGSARDVEQGAQMAGPPPPNARH